MQFKIITIEVTPFAQNARIILSTATGEGVLIDPGGDAERIIEIIEAERIKIKEIWLTHSHLDHCGGVKALKQHTGAMLFGHPIEREFRMRVRDVAAMYGLPPGLLDDCPEPDRYLTGGEKITFGGIEFDVIFTPGHSPGHLVFYCSRDGFLIAGDTIFAGSIGRTDLPGGDHELLLKNIREKIFSLPDQTVVMPGHGPDTTVGEEKRSNQFLGEN